MFTFLNLFYISSSSNVFNGFVNFKTLALYFFYGIIAFQIFMSKSLILSVVLTKSLNFKELVLSNFSEFKRSVFWVSLLILKGACVEFVSWLELEHVLSKSPDFTRSNIRLIRISWG